MAEKNIDKRLEGMQQQLTEESHMRLSAEREQREAHAQYVKEHNARRDDLERFVGYICTDVCDQIKALKKGLGQIEAYCFQVGACFPEELKKQRDELVEAINQYHIQVDRLLSVRKQQIRTGDFYGESKPEVSDSHKPQ
mgnify:CR=1 FL=1